MYIFALKQVAPIAAQNCARLCALNVETGILAMDKELFGNGGSPP